MPHARSVEESGDDDKSPSLEKMQTIDEINDLECSFETENVIKEIIKLEDQKPADSAITTQQRLETEAEIDAVEESLKIGAAITDIDEVALKDNYYFKEDNNSICSNTDTYTTLESSDEDNESDVFTDALPTLEEDEGANGEKHVEETHADNFERQENTILYAQTNLPINVIELVSQAGLESIITDVELQETTERPKINAKELQDTLKAIKDNFRANIATATTIPTSNSYTTTIDSQSFTPRPLTHNKGKAPDPPLPLRPTCPAGLSSSTAVPNSMLDATSLSSRSSSPASHRNIFKNIKSNLLRFASNNSLTGKATEATVEKPTTPYETQL